MRTLFTIAILAFSIHRAPAPFMSTAFTTNDTPTALNVVTNIASLTTAKIAAAGGLTTGNFSTYADPAGAATTALSTATNYSEARLLANPYGWITPSATNAMTPFKTNVVTSVAASTGISVSSSLDSTGYHITIASTGTNNASITNLNPTVLANAGALTTNNFGTYADLAGAAQAATNDSIIAKTNNIHIALSLTNASAFDAAGLATASTNGGNLRFTNFPVVGNISITSNINLTAITNSRGEINYTMGSSAGVVAGVYQPLTNNLFGWSLISTGQVVIGTNTISTLVAGTNILLTAVTNSGAVSVTVNVVRDPTVQSGSVNTTNWSSIPTNAIIISTNLVSRIVAGTAVTVSAATNATGITYTVNSTATPTTVRAGTFTASSGGSGSVVFSSTMGSTPVVSFGPEDWGVNASGKSYVIITARSATGFSWSNANDSSGVSKTIDYIAILPQ